MLAFALQFASCSVIAAGAGILGFLVREELYRREQERQHQRIMTPPRMSDPLSPDEKTARLNNVLERIRLERESD